MNKEQENRIREEKLNTLKSMLWELGHTDKDAHHVIEYVDELLKSQREEERLRSAKIVEELMEDSEHWQPIASRIMDRVIIGKEDLSLIKNN